MDEKALAAGGIGAAMLALLAAALTRRGRGKRDWERFRGTPGALAAREMPSSQIMEAVRNAAPRPQPAPVQRNARTPSRRKRPG